MPFLADTSVMIGLVERGNPMIRTLIESSTSPWIGSLIVRGELLFGIEEADDANRDARALTLAVYERLTTWRPPSTDLYRTLPAAFGGVSAAAIEQRARLGQNDRWVIAEATVAGADLVTEDRVQAAVATRWYQRSAPSLSVHLV